MSVDWKTFKSNLGCLQNTFVVYVDEEGSEIPIDSDLEFQEALRLAKLKNNHLKLILYDGRTQRNTTKCKPEITIINLSEKLLQRVNDEKKSSVLINSNLKKNICHCNEDGPPEWFMHYMKKFKKDLLYELKTNSIDTVENTVEKSKKFSNKKSDFLKDFACFNKNLIITTTSTTNQFPCSTPTPSKKKKKVLEKDSLDLIDQRAIKETKRLENKTDKFEKVDNVRFILQEKKSLDTKSMLKTKPETMDSVIKGVENTVRKPYYFRKYGVFLFLIPGGEFTIDVNVINDGKVGWAAPRLKCFELMGLQVEEPSIELPKLLPKESCVATIRGRAAKTVGLQHFEFTLVDGEEKIGSQFTCWARVESFEPYETYCNVWVHCNSPDSITLRTGAGAGTSIDFETNLIANSEKKIEENIMEIEKRLREIDFLRPSFKEEVELKKIEDKPKNLNGEKALSCDSLKNSKDTEKNFKEMQDQEEILLGIDCLRLTPESRQTSAKKTKSNKDQSKKGQESETSSDSELSVICMSEDETFIVVPFPSKSPSPPTQSVSEDKGASNGKSVIKPVDSKEQSESEEAKELIKPDTKKESLEQVNKEVPPKEDSHSGQLSPVRTRRSPFGEEISEFKPKKMKSKSTEYHFTTANLTQPTFTPIPEEFFGVRPCTFTFTGEEKEKSQGDGRFKGEPSKFTFTAEKEDKSKKEGNFTVRNVPKADALGRVIYAVNVNGYCLPVKDLFNNGEHGRSSKEGSCRKEEGGSKSKCDKRNEIPAVNILPNAFMSGASNVASLAFNTAKSVINNLQSAFVTEGKTELGKPACEDKKKLSMEAMFKLYEMGFSDLHLNQELLLKNDNDLLKVVEELVHLEENPSRQPQ